MTQRWSIEEVLWTLLAEITARDAANARIRLNNVVFRYSRRWRRSRWRVLKLAADGTPVDQYPPCAGPGDCSATSGSDPGQFYDHTGLVTDGQGNLYFADTCNDRIERLIVVEVPNPSASPGAAEGSNE